MKKMDLLHVYANENKLDIIFVTETLFNSNIADGEVEFNGFNCYRCDRQNKVGQLEGA